MKNIFRKDSKLDDEVDAILKAMALVGPGTEEYERELAHLERMMALQNTETWTRRLNPDTVAVVLGNITLAVFIRAYEDKHVAVSKVFGMFQRTKNGPM